MRPSGRQIKDLTHACWLFASFINPLTLVLARLCLPVVWCRLGHRAQLGKGWAMVFTQPRRRDSIRSPSAAAATPPLHRPLLLLLLLALSPHGINARPACHHHHDRAPAFLYNHRLRLLPPLPGSAPSQSAVGPSRAQQPQPQPQLAPPWAAGGVHYQRAPEKGMRERGRHATSPPATCARLEEEEEEEPT